MAFPEPSPADALFPSSVLDDWLVVIVLAMMNKVWHLELEFIMRSLLVGMQLGFSAMITSRSPKSLVPEDRVLSHDHIHQTTDKSWYRASHKLRGEVCRIITIIHELFIMRLASSTLSTAP